ncbi:hypothetical protein L9H26_04030 [Morganella psychrotolerans]|uniref:hypothetical protein n=1 Tax=Morganella psychrotolerans TaxID=368603 RepID=UPI000AEB8615|nr:hypothetical protein [Morganella psychrotolerans]
MDIELKKGDSIRVSFLPFPVTVYRVYDDFIHVIDKNGDMYQCNLDDTGLELVNEQIQ